MTYNYLVFVAALGSFAVVQARSYREAVRIAAAGGAR